jgi:hypothetical protein
VREQERKAMQGGEAEPPRKDKRKGESVEERRSRVAVVQARKGRDVDKRERARNGKRGGSQGLLRSRSRSRT